MKRLVVALALICCACAAPPPKQQARPPKYDLSSDSRAQALIAELSICQIIWIGENDDLVSDARTVARAAAGACTDDILKAVRHIYTSAGATEQFIARRSRNLPHDRDVDRALPLVFEFRKELSKEIYKELSRQERRERAEETIRRPRRGFDI